MATTPRRESRLATRGFATKREERQHRMRTRLSAAATAEEQLSAAYDWFRMSARHVKDAGLRAQSIHAAAEFLAGMAAEMDGGA